MRHSFATEMIRLGVSLPALMQLLGHKDIRMTMRYVAVAQLDLQSEFYQARQKAAQPHRCPILSVPNASPSADLPMYRRQLTDEKTRRTLQRLDRRLLDIDSRLDRLATAGK